ncbi:hypothetical protein [Chromobacterium haemolyticum]|uniref:hypothetical protein n=1 Tax=Chromobacterium haemolyticum TaxID=394935 RepID=UPI00244931AA|nr:hypothetical protein [Chromobacterium haemolyticum]MDH0343425.1 hypothetical protein [Chromobacterium haemolyticum]
MFGSLQRDRVTVHRKNGEKYEKQAASVQGDRIFMMGFQQLIEAGDLIERHMSNGGVETYEVVDPGWHEGTGGAIPAGYQMKVRKAGSAPATAQPQAVTYNIYGQNARVNNNSVDHSTNVVVGGQEDNEALTALIDVMRSALERGEVLGETADELKAELTTLQAQASSPKPKWQVIKATAGSIKAVLENAAGSMLATQALPYLLHLLK